MRVRTGLTTGLLAFWTLIAAAVAEDPDLGERASIKEFDGNMTMLDAQIATLHDALDEAGQYFLR